MEIIIDGNTELSHSFASPPHTSGRFEFVKKTALEGPEERLMIFSKIETTGLFSDSRSEAVSMTGNLEEEVEVPRNIAQIGTISIRISYVTATHKDLKEVPPPRNAIGTSRQPNVLPERAKKGYTHNVAYDFISHFI